jgi:hypothetical protein
VVLGPLGVAAALVLVRRDREGRQVRSLPNDGLADLSARTAGTHDAGEWRNGRRAGFGSHPARALCFTFAARCRWPEVYASAGHERAPATVGNTAPGRSLRGPAVAGGVACRRLPASRL